MPARAEKGYLDPGFLSLVLSKCADVYHGRGKTSAARLTPERMRDRSAWMVLYAGRRVVVLNGCEGIARW